MFVRVKVKTFKYPTTRTKSVFGSPLVFIKFQVSFLQVCTASFALCRNDRIIFLFGSHVYMAMDFLLLAGFLDAFSVVLVVSIYLIMV